MPSTTLKAPLLQDKNSGYALIDEEDVVDAEFAPRRKNNSGNNVLLYCTLATAIAAIVVGSVAISELGKVKSEQNEQKKETTQNHLAAKSNRDAAEATRCVSTHPASVAHNGANYFAFNKLLDTHGKFMRYAYNETTGLEDVRDRVHRGVDAFGVRDNYDFTAVVLHDGVDVADSGPLLQDVVGRQSILSDLSACQCSFDSTCFACVPVPIEGYGCLPILHFTLDPNEKIADVATEAAAERRRRRSLTAIKPTPQARQPRTGTIVGHPWTGGLSRTRRDDSSDDNSGFSDSWSGSSDIDAGGSQIGSANADASAETHFDSDDSNGPSFSAGASAEANGHAEVGASQDLGLGFESTESAEVNGHAEAGVDVGAHATSKDDGEDSSFSIGANADASASVTGNVEAGADLTNGDLSDSANNELHSMAGVDGDDEPLVGASASGSVSAHAGASAEAAGSIGEHGISGSFGANAGAGVSASGEAEAHAGGFSVETHGSVSAGPEAGIGGSFHATHSDDGTYSIGASGAIAAGLGLDGGVDVSFNPSEMAKTAGDDIHKAVNAVDNFFGGDSDSGN